MTQQDPNSLLENTKAFAARTEQLGAALSSLLRIQRQALGGDRYNPAAVAKWLESAATVTLGCPDLEKGRNDLLESWRRALSVSFLHLEADLREMCRSRGWRIDGQWPDFVVEYGVSVRLNEQERTASIGALSSAANLVAIEKALNQQIPSLIPKNFSPHRFLDSLFRAWEAATESRGGQAPILDVYRWFVIHSQAPKFWRDATASLFTPLTTDQFRARLSRALESGIREGGKRDIRLLPPLDPKDALFIYQPSEDRFGFVGRLDFVEVSGRGA
jgi:hypothetical protein